MPGRGADPSRWVLAYVVGSLVQVLADLLGLQVIAAIAIVPLMPLLAAWLISAGQHRTRLGRWVLAALVFSWCGDVIGVMIEVKIAFFLLAQLCYITAFWPYRGRRVPNRAVLGLYVAVVGVLVIGVGLESGRLLVPVLAYGSALGLMAVLATGVHPLAGIGGAIFVLSDAMLGVDTFVESVDLPFSDALVMLSYTAAQLLLVTGARRRMSEPVPSDAPQPAPR
jgi:uncharacterized membrane protein YhhN